jgi:N-acetyl-alpha-D-glucosaminyl L-malate synthase BshA
MRIGMMCHASFGGSARIGIELAIALAGRGHRVHLFTRTTPLGGWDRSNGVVLHTLLPDATNTLHPATLHTNWSARDLQRYTESILQVIVDERLDVLHFHYAVPFACVAQRVRHCLGDDAPRLVGTLHGTDVTHCGKDPAVAPKLAAALGCNDVLTTVSNSHSQLAASVFNLTSRPRVVSNFIDLARFKPCPEASPLSDPARPRRIVHVSNFRPIKDTPSVARIFLGIRERLEAELWLVGGGEDLPAVRELLDRSDYADDVRYLGLQRNVTPFLRGADLLLVTSLYESFCLVALEAMACGAPVLATRVGGVPEVVRQGRTGLLFPLGDNAEAVDLAVDLLTDPARHEAMRRAAIRHAGRFGVAQGVQAYEALYQPQNMEG